MCYLVIHQLFLCIAISSVVCHIQNNRQFKTYVFLWKCTKIPLDLLLGLNYAVNPYKL